MKPTRRSELIVSAAMSCRSTTNIVGAEPVAAEPPLRYFLLRRLIGLPSLRLYWRTLVGAGLWLLGPPLAAQALGRRGARRSLHRLDRWWARRVARHLRIELDLRGLEYIDPSQRYIVIPLHEGFADVLALLHLPLDLRFAVRDELLRWRLLGPYLRDAGHISLRPEQGVRSYRRLLRAAGPVFDAGDSLVIFPQGTILGIETDFMAGAFALARATGRPLLPIALTGGHRVWEHPYTPRLRYGQQVSLHVLPPVFLQRQFAGDIEAARMTIQRQVKNLALDGSLAPPRHFVPERDGFWDGYAFRIDPEFAALAAEVEAHQSTSSGDKRVRRKAGAESAGSTRP